jgi:hypothetical protein
MTSRRPTQIGRLVGAAIAFGGLGSAVESFAASPSPTKAAAKSFATAVNLHAGDVPGFKAGTVSKTTAADRKTAAAVAKCAGGVNPSRAVIDSSSRDFNGTAGLVRQQISSEVEVLPSSALVARDLAAAKSTRGKACVERALDKQFAALKVPGAKFGKISVESQPLQANGATGSFAYRFTLPVTVHGQRIHFYADNLGFTLGKAEVTLSAFGFGVPVSGTDELGLFSLLLRRAEAASL